MGKMIRYCNRSDGTFYHTGKDSCSNITKPIYYLEDEAIALAKENGRKNTTVFKYIDTEASYRSKP